MCWTSNFFSSVRRQDLETQWCHTRPRPSFLWKISMKLIQLPFQGQRFASDPKYLICFLYIFFLFGWGFSWFVFFLLDFAFSLQLWFVANYKYSFQYHVLSKWCHHEKLNLQVFTYLQNPWPSFLYFKCLLPNIYSMFNSVIYLIIWREVPFDLGLRVKN